METCTKGPVERVTKIFEASIAPLQNARGPPVPTVAHRVEESIPSIPAAPDQDGKNAEGNESADTTPTPSGSPIRQRETTKSTGRTRNNSKIYARPLSQLLSSLSSRRIESMRRAMQNSTNSILTRGDDGKVDQPAEMSIESNADLEEVQKQRSDSMQTEVQSAQDPPFAPTERCPNSVATHCSYGHEFH